VEDGEAELVDSNNRVAATSHLEEHQQAIAEATEAVTEEAVSLKCHVLEVDMVEVAGIAIIRQKRDPGINAEHNFDLSGCPSVCYVRDLCRASFAYHSCSQLG